jgi:hypothetical protein
MSRKTSTARREAFFRALRETGNQTLACERAKVSRSWVTLHRAADPGFRARIEAEIAVAKAELSGAAERKPPGGWGAQGGEELVVKGTGGAGGGKRIQIARARLKQWTPRTEDRFLAALAATCNVKLACAEVGMTAASAYGHRQRWPRFAARWDAAVEEAYARIELALVANACQTMDPAALLPEVEMAPMTVAQAIHILHMHKREVKAIGGKPGRWRRPRSLDEVRGSILKKLAAFQNAGR